MSLAVETSDVITMTGFLNQVNYQNNLMTIILTLLKSQTDSSNRKQKRFRASLRQRSDDAQSRAQFGLRRRP